MKPLLIVLYGIFLGLIISGVMLLIVRSPRDRRIELIPAPTEQDIMVQVIGAVNQPGIYSLEKRSRVIDAVNAAGGFSSQADQSAINLVAILSDESLIRIPYLGETETSDILLEETAINNSPDKVIPIDINQCSQADLEGLPGIGSQKAADIIAYRNEHGPFKTIEDIMDVPGIGSIIFEKIVDFIMVDPGG